MNHTKLVSPHIEVKITHIPMVISRLDVRDEWLART